MYIIVEQDDGILCDAKGTMTVFTTREAAHEHAVKFSAQNRGVYSIVSLYDSKVPSFHRLCVEHENPWKSRSVLSPLKG